MQQFDYMPKVKDDIVKYIQHFEEIIDQIKTEVQHLADVKVATKSSTKNDSRVVLTVKPIMKVNNYHNSE